MVALIVGTVLAIGALAFVLYPLFVETAPAPVRAEETATRAANAAEQDAIVALREIEFDRATGKLSDSDYDELCARYTERALQAMRSGEGTAVDTDPVEAAVLAYRARMVACSRCGPRPEAGAIYCSNCGGYLPGACGRCGSTVSESGAAFCTNCGCQLAA